MASYEESSGVNSEAAGSSASGSVDNDYTAWAKLVEKIKANDPAGMEELYAVFSKGIRFFLYRRVGSQEIEDRLHDTFLIVVQAIRRGDLREPERLMGYVRTVLRRQVAAHIEQAVHDRRHLTELEPGIAVADVHANPETELTSKEREQFARKVLGGVSERDREILTRFYLDEQSAERICRDMNLTDTQFRLLKSRAKARFGDMGRRKLNRRKWLPE